MAATPVAEKSLAPYILAPPPSEERGLASSPIRYFLIATAISAIAGAILPFCLPAALVLMVISAWFLWSATIIVANKTAVGTKMEGVIRHLHSVANEVNAGIASACLFPMTLLKSYHDPKGNREGRPILLVNGYLSFGSTWHYQRQRLIEEGFGPIYTMNIGSGKSIKTYAEHVRDRVKEIQKETGRYDLILVGHSKGGLVSSYFTNYLAREIQSEVTDVVTIGSPLAGTNLAYFGPGHDAAEMRTDSPFHKELRRRIDRNIATRFFHIASSTDEVVPSSSALIGTDPSRQLLLKDTGHLGLVYSSRVANQISQWLKS